MWIKTLQQQGIFYDCNPIVAESHKWLICEVTEVGHVLVLANSFIVYVRGLVKWLRYSMTCISLLCEPWLWEPDNSVWIIIAKLQTKAEVDVADSLPSETPSKTDSDYTVAIDRTLCAMTELAFRPFLSSSSTRYNNAYAQVGEEDQWHRLTEDSFFSSCLRNALLTAFDVIVATHEIEAQVHKSATRNAQLLHILAETDHALPALEQRCHFITELDHQIHHSDEKLQSLKKKCDSGLKAHQKVRHSQLRRFVYTATGHKEAFAHKEESGERDYMDALQRMQREHAVNQSLKEQRKEATRTTHELEDAAKRHRDAQRKLNELYHTIFSGPTPQFPEEDEAEKMCHHLVLRYRTARRWWEAETRAVQLLTEGNGLMEEALGLTRDALSYSRAELVGTGGGLYEMMERNRLSKADRLVSLARLQMAKAQKVSPHVKALSGESSHVRSVYINAYCDDMTFRDEVKRNIGDTQRYSDAVKAELDAALQRQAKLKDYLEQRRAELRDGRAVLQKARECVFETVLRDRAKGKCPNIVPVAHTRSLIGTKLEEEEEEDDGDEDDEDHVHV
ncbi:hypothetical protein L249_5702 [Ophiocordyceps polyrhachis-furcata BCC 54312]|uniref:Uncharacterized protein n=1 Tax=Ophiocordyceps polyrhachis-furcata BCC 54312 TaxID=1330021 RepID=A0A367L035_9HYPO|nr:hypothetical protein L249_5702 [Ophiocordyceps polyrhachis-furcata BCC 54312]